MTRVRILLPDSSCRLGGVLLAALIALLIPSLVRADSDVIRAVEQSATFEARLRTLCDELGPRLAGTPGMARAANWAINQFEAAGVDGAWLEPFEIPRSWSDGGTEIRISEPTEFALKAVATVWSPRTRRGQPDLELIRSDGLGAGSISRLGDKARGRAVLVLLDEAKTFSDMGVQEGHAIRAMREAGEAGVAAVLFASIKPNRVLYRHVHTIDARMDPVPSAVLAREDALRVGRLLESGETVKASVSIAAKQGGPVRGVNVVGEIRGSELPDEVVILGAHLDSWDLGTGCLDNGVNAVGVIEAAQAIVASGKRPRRTIRFVLFDGEEYGLFGSRAYVSIHRSELDSVAAVVVHDMGQDRIRGYSLGGRPELEHGLREAMSGIDNARGMRHMSDAFIGSDHFDFQLEGVPALVAIQDTTSYVLPYHSEVDTFDRVDMDQVRARAEVAAATVYGMAIAEQRIGPRLSREGVERLLRRSGMADQMKFLRLWDDWESGQRGRQADP